MIWTRLIEIRKAKGWSQKELGRRLGLSGAAVSMWESGTTAPSYDNLRALAAALEVHVSDLATEQADDAFGVERYRLVKIKGTDGVRMAVLLEPDERMIESAKKLAILSDDGCDMAAVVKLMQDALAANKAPALKTS